MLVYPQPYEWRPHPVTPEWVKIGLEVHVALNTKTKLFCKDPIGGEIPNTNVCQICLGYPGSKPILNKKAVELAIKTAMILNCEINKKSWFDRKVYFYPDLAKNYQITQHEATIGKNGYLDIGNKRIRIREIHIEEDPAKIVYPSTFEKSEYVLLDYNRSGTPLVEIVTEPDFSSIEEVSQFFKKLLKNLEYSGIFDPTKEGALRCDVNVSVEGGERVEVKNVSGLENIKKALNYEILRQNLAKSKGEKIERETRHFDENLGITIPMRTKETEEDYGYIFDPDLPFIELNDEYIQKLKEELGELADQRRERLMKEYNLNKEFANSLVSEREMADLFEYCAKEIKDYNFIARWIAIYLKKSLNWNNVKLENSKITKEQFLDFLNKIKSGEILEREAKEIIKEWVSKGEFKIGKIGKEDIDRAIEEVAKEIPKNIDERGLNHFIGEVLKKVNYRADPKEIRKLLLQKIKENS